MHTELREYLVRLATAVCDGDGQAMAMLGTFKPRVEDLINMIEGHPDEIGSAGHTLQLRLRRALELHARPELGQAVRPTPEDASASRS